MKQALKIISVLTIACVLCAFLLSVVYKSTYSKIQDNAQTKINDAITNLVPEAITINEEVIGQERIYKLFNKKEKLIGYAFSASGQGYQGKIKMLVATNSKLEYLKGIEVIDSLETPGLGARINEADFENQFNKLDISSLVELTKDSSKKNKIQAITGATVSSQAVVNILNKKIEKIKKLLKR